jgi:peroxiredoxin
MTRLFAAAALVALIASPAFAALKTGEKAPGFTLPAALAGKDFTFDMASALKKGPVVVYFYPKAFTSGCSAEAHEFAEHMDDFKALGATVIGVSGDTIAALESFSTKDCGSKFPVAADPKGEVIAKYDVALPGMAAKTMLQLDHASNRTSFLVAPDGTVVAVHSAMDFSKHVPVMLDALKSWKAGQKA